jgi:hypothetical protein
MSEPGIVRDDDLEGMLGTRADRLPAHVGREVIAAVRAEVRGPKGGVGFAVLPVTRGRGSRAPVGIAAIGLVAVLVLAVTGGRLDAKPSSPAASPHVGLGTPGQTSGTSPVPPASTVGGPTASTLTMDGLRAGIDAGTLEGRTVMLTGSLELQPWPCPSPAPDDCFGLQIRGLDGVEVTHDGVITMDEAYARTLGDSSSERLMAFRVTGNQLALLGWVTQGAEVPLTVNGLLTANAPIPGRGDVALVSGWLTAGSPGSGCGPVPVETACDPGPLLSDAPPMKDGSFPYAQSVNVSLDPSVTFGPDGAAPAGPFLVGYRFTLGGDFIPPWTVIASLDPANTVWVGATSSPAAMTPDLLRTAVRDGSMDGRLFMISGYLQPSGGQCAAELSQPCTLYVFLGLEGIDVTWEGWVATMSRMPLVEPSNLETLVVTPRSGRLVLLGRLQGSLDSPFTVQQLLERREYVSDPLALLPVAGWLVVGGIHSCPTLGPGATACPSPDSMLSDGEPGPDRLIAGNFGASVVVGDATPGVEPGRVVTPGPFLVRTSRLAASCAFGLISPSPSPACRGGLFAQLEVVARYDGGNVTQVAIP